MNKQFETAAFEYETRERILYYKNLLVVAIIAEQTLSTSTVSWISEIVDLNVFFVCFLFQVDLGSWNIGSQSIVELLNISYKSSSN